jgi:hypothetical protein
VTTRARAQVRAVSSEPGDVQVHAVAGDQKPDDQTGAAKQRELFEDFGFNWMSTNSTREQPCDSSHLRSPKLSWALMGSEKWFRRAGQHSSERKPRARLRWRVSSGPGNGQRSEKEGRGAGKGKSYCRTNNKGRRCAEKNRVLHDHLLFQGTRNATHMLILPDTRSPQRANSACEMPSELAQARPCAGASCMHDAGADRMTQDTGRIPDSPAGFYGRSKFDLGGGLFCNTRHVNLARPKTL